MLQSPGGHDCRNGTSESEQKWDKCASGEPKPAHDVIHDKGNSGHISAVFQKCEGKEQNEYIGQEGENTTYTCDDTIHHKGLKHRIGMYGSQTIGYRRRKQIQCDLKISFQEIAYRKGQEKYHCHNK